MKNFRMLHMELMNRPRSFFFWNYRFGAISWELKLEFSQDIFSVQFIFNEFVQTDCEHFSELQVVGLVEMVPFISTLRWPTEGRLQSERVYQAELFPHYHSRATFSTFLDYEVAVVETEILV